jgi:acetyltransferase-like isoleucine patch superfamily enzyme
MIRLIAKVLNWIIWTIRSICDGIVNWITIQRSQVSIGASPRFNGRIIVKNKGKIVIGDKLLINSHSWFNPVGIPHETILATIQSEAFIKIGDNVGISGASIVAQKGISIGNNVLIGGGTGIWDTDFHPLSLDGPSVETSAAPIEIGNQVFIGARVTILKGVKIGHGAIIAAGSVVNRDVPDGYLCFGNPMQLRSK